MSEAATSCPKCGAAIPPEAPQGLCPKCLLKQASFPTETGPTTRHTRPAPPDRDELAAAFPHLQILELIGQGGMGFVYKARQPKLDRLVALKILAQPLAEQTHFAERFTREGRTLAKLNHPNIVTIHDFGQAGPFFYLLMEYVDGVNLRQAMKAGAVNSTQALAIVPRICEALQYAHNEGILHRDIKPDNILLDTRGRVKIADFGIAKLMAEAVAENPLTGSGASLGTPHYMAPEQIEKPNAVDHRADIYSLGVVFYEMLTGELPLGRFAAPSEKSAIDPRLDEVVFQTLEKQPERRPQSADEVKTKVETISSNPHAESDPATQPVTFKMSRCYITTPEFLQRWIGRFFRYTGSGELRLDQENLTFSPRGNWIVMPLRSITNLSLCDLPGWAGKLDRGLKLISVTFTEKSQTHRLFFIPNLGAFSPIWETSRHVEEWFGAIQLAVKARTGRVPPSHKDDIVPLPLTSTRNASFSSALLKGAFTLALIVILGLSVGLGVFIGLYALLHHPNPRQPDFAAIPNPPVLTSNTTATIVARTGLSRKLENVTVSGTNHVLELRTSTEPTAGEHFVPVIRYGNGPWGENDGAMLRHEYRRSAQGPKHEATFWWNLPSGFNSGYETAAAVLRTRASLAEHPIAIYTNYVEPIFDLANPAGQSVFVGLRVEKTPITPLSLPITATLSGFKLQTSTENGRTYLTGGGNADIPPGYRLQPIAFSNEQELFSKSFDSKTYDPDGQFWNYWSLPPNYSPYIDANANQTRTLKITYGEPLIVFSRTNYVAELELVPLLGITPPPIISKPARSQIERPEQISPFSANVEPAAPTPSRPITISHVDAGNSHVDVWVKTEPLAGESFIPVIRYGGGPLSGPWGQSPVINSTAQWTRKPEGTVYSQMIIWNLPKDFTSDFDLAAAALSAQVRAEQGPIEITSEGTALFTVQNSAASQILSGGLRLVKTTAPPVQNPVATFMNFNVSFKANNSTWGPQGLLGSGAANVPAGYLVQPVAREAGKELVTSHTIAERVDRFVWPVPSQIPGIDFTKFVISKELLEVKIGEPVQVFAFTNQTGLIYEALLELVPMPGIGLMPHRERAGTPGNLFPEEPRTLDVVTVAVTNFQHIVLRTTTEATVGERFVPVVRYGDGPWSQSDIATKRLAWSTDKSGQHHLGTYDWNVPSGFNTESQMNAAVSAARFRAEQGPLALFTEPTVVFAITNEAGQKFSGGLKVASVSLTNKNTTATFKEFAALSKSDAPGGFIAGGKWEVPEGHRLQALGYEGSTPLETKARNDNVFPQFEWSWPTQFPNSVFNYIKYSRENLQIKAGEPYTVFAFTNEAGVVYKAQLALIHDGVFRSK